MKKRIVTAILSGVLSIALLGGISTTTIAGPIQAQAAATTDTMQAETKAPKYVFMFIGDGMSYPQVQLANYYTSITKNTNPQKIKVEDEEKEVLKNENQLALMNLSVAGTAQTYDSTSFAPDSASTATSLATGNKTWSGSINVSEDFSKKYETIAEKLKKQKGYKIGIISSVNLNHATPAAFYAHQQSRGNYYEIGEELIASDFDYFAGGGLLMPTGKEEDQTDLYKVAEEAGYKVIKTQAEAEKHKAEDGKAILIHEKLADADAMTYELDREENEWALADYVEKGIETLEGDEGFFMMVEGGKIDWACHANDAATTIKETIAMDQAVQKAVDFYQDHPDETLILVTGDHETGGLTIGFAGTDYDTFLQNFDNQKISYAKYDSDYVSDYKEKKTDFETVCGDIEKLFGLKTPSGEAAASQAKDSKDQHPESEQDGGLEMTDYEFNQLKTAYETTMSRTGEEEEFGQEEYLKYGSYEPLTVTITHILNNKSGVNFGSYAHTGLPVEVLVEGVGADSFDGYYDNTDIYKKMAALLGVK